AFGLRACPGRAGLVQAIGNSFGRAPDGDGDVEERFAGPVVSSARSARPHASGGLGPDWSNSGCYRHASGALPVSFAAVLWVRSIGCCPSAVVVGWTFPALLGSVAASAFPKPKRSAHETP